VDVTVVVKVERVRGRCNFWLPKMKAVPSYLPYFDIYILAIDLTRTKSRMKLSGVFMYKCCRLHIFSNLVSILNFLRSSDD